MQLCGEGMGETGVGSNRSNIVAIHCNYVERIWKKTVEMRTYFWCGDEDLSSPGANLGFPHVRERYFSGVRRFRPRFVGFL